MDNGNVITTSLQAYLEIQSRHSKCSQAGKSSTWCSPSSSVLNTELCKSNTGYFFFNCFLGKKRKQHSSDLGFSLNHPLRKQKSAFYNVTGKKKPAGSSAWQHSEPTHFWIAKACSVKQFLTAMLCRRDSSGRQCNK